MYCTLCREDEDRIKTKEKSRLYREKNKDKIKIKRDEWRAKNPDYQKNRPEDKKEQRRKKVLDKYHEDMKDPIKRDEKRKSRLKYHNNKYRTDPAYKLNCIISSGLHKHMKYNGVCKNRRHWEDIVGYTKEELMSHLESLFQPGMNWGNQGKNGWHIDHIVAKSKFKYTSTDDVEFEKCWSLSNLQPLWAEDNMRKWAN